VTGAFAVAATAILLGLAVALALCPLCVAIAVDA
jgi:hypothetical protein